METIAQVKTCRKCGAARPVDEFVRDPRRRDGVRGYCRECDSAKRRATYVRAPHATPGERFAALVRETPAVHPLLGTPCREWTGGIDEDGYGRFRVGHHGVFKAHRYAWQLATGEDPGALCVLHKCDNRRCVRPDHLFLGTRPENMADMAEKHRSTIGERNPRARLTNAAVVEIRARLSAGESHASLARAFGVSTRTIQGIHAGNRWRRVG